MVSVLNMLGTQFAIFGNHDFGKHVQDTHAQW